MRFVSFTIPGEPGVLVRMSEQPGGSVLFELEVVGGKLADLRGLFFDVRDPGLLGTLSVRGPAVTGSQFRDEGVTNLGEGVNMNGAGRGPFDVGVAFGTAGRGKDAVNKTAFVLSSSEPQGSLTLDDLALVDFAARLTSVGSAGSGRSGSLKLTGTAPAAPDALDDVVTAPEDGPTVFRLLDNDRDEDNLGELRIVSVTDPARGTVTIAADGKSVVYVGDDDYSGPDSFEYTVSDGRGGGDTARALVGVTAVADAPTLSVTTAAGASVNQILITVTVAVTDTDGSEYIDRFEFTGLPEGVQLLGAPGGRFDPAAQAGTLTQTFTLVLPMGRDFDFDLGVTAVSKELSNGDEEATARAQSVELNFTSTTQDANFLALDQSIWGPGEDYVYEADYFLGFQQGFDRDGGGFVEYEVDGSVKAGLNARVTFEGGEIDASAPYEVTVETHYNKTTDVLLITAAALREAASFVTSGMEGAFGLDLIFNYDFDGKVELDFGDLGKPDLFDFDLSRNFFATLFTLQNEDLPAKIPIWPGFLTVGLNWPDLVTQGQQSSSGEVTGAGFAKDFFSVIADMDRFLTAALGFSPLGLEFNVGVAGGEASLIDLDLTTFADFSQTFTLAIQRLAGTITFEDGSTQAFEFGQDIVINDASRLDLDGDGVEFSIALAPIATLRNDTDLAFRLGFDFEVLNVNGWYDVEIDSGDFSLGPVYNLERDYPVGSTGVYDEVFDLRFAAQTFGFVA